MDILEMKQEAAWEAAEADAENQVNAWKHPIGTEIEWEVEGKRLRGRTVSKAYLKSSTDPVVEVEGSSTPIPLSSIQFPPSRGLPKYIQDAINLGLADRLQEEANKEQQEQQTKLLREARKLKEKMEAEVWSITELPNLIRETVAKGEFWVALGSKEDITAECRAEVCEKLGMRVHCTFSGASDLIYRVYWDKV